MYKSIVNYMVRQYAEVDTECKKFWDDQKKLIQFCQHSERAAKIISPKMSKEDFKKKIHREHIVPAAQIVKELFALKNPSIEEVSKVVAQSEVVLVTKEEANALGGSKSKEYPLDGKMVTGKGLSSKGSKEERLQAIGARISADSLGNEIG